MSSIQSEVKGSLYIMASTLNQMVNYIPYKYFGFDKIWNITTKDSKNQNWDGYFETTIGKRIHKIEFERQDILKISSIKDTLTDKLNVLAPSKIFWNITGGQRPVVMAIYDLVRELKDYTHFLGYLEGNSGQMRIDKYENGELSDDLDEIYDYKIEGLTIDIALKLMGFENKEPTKDNFLKTNKMDKKDFYINTFYPEYIKNGDLRKKLSDFNVNVDNLDKLNTKRRKNHNDVISEITKCSVLLQADMDKYWKDFEEVKAFGYILEEMAAYLILENLTKPTLLDKVADMHTSSKIKADYFTNDKKAIDEFDILLLTKTGRLINFECKSGDMSGDNAKSNKYSTYAISGVYGLPILISPALKQEIKDDKFTNDSIKGAYNAAQRANLQIWAIDAIKDELEKLLNN